MVNEVEIMNMMCDEIGKILEVLESINNNCISQQNQINMLKFKVSCLSEQVNRIDPDYQLIKSVMNPESKEPYNTLTYYTTRCTSCGKVSPVGDYCIWCGEKDTCLEGGDDDEKTTSN